MEMRIGMSAYGNRNEEVVISFRSRVDIVFVLNLSISKIITYLGTCMYKKTAICWLMSAGCQRYANSL